MRGDLAFLQFIAQAVPQYTPSSPNTSKYLFKKKKWGGFNSFYLMTLLMALSLLTLTVFNFTEKQEL